MNLTRISFAHSLEMDFSKTCIFVLTSTYIISRNTTTFLFVNTLSVLSYEDFQKVYKYVAEQVKSELKNLGQYKIKIVNINSY